MRTHVDRTIAELVSFFRSKDSESQVGSVTENPTPANDNAENRDESSSDRPRPETGPQLRLVGGHTDLRHALPRRASDYSQLYSVEPTTWGLDSGFNPPPCAPAPVPASPWPAVPNPGPQAPPIPRIARRHEPKPFRLFDEAL